MKKTIGAFQLDAPNFVRDLNCLHPAELNKAVCMRTLVGPDLRDRSLELFREQIRRQIRRFGLLFCAIAISLTISGCGEGNAVKQDPIEVNFSEAKKGNEITSPGPSKVVRIVPKAENFECTPTHVWDGDGPIWCLEGPRVRLAGIAAREIDETCRPDHPCPSAGGVEARDSLVNLLGQPIGEGQHGHILVSGPPLQCVSTGGAGGKRTGAWCQSDIIGDLSCAMIHEGSALRWDKFWEDGHC
jgi:hypothetical protein